MPERLRLYRRGRYLCDRSGSLVVEEDLGTETAVDVAKRLVLFLRRTGAQPQLSTTLLAQTSPAGSISNVLIWMADNLEQDLSVTSLARRVAMSPRNFARHFLSAVGKTPGRHVRDLRLEPARRNLAHGNLSLSGEPRRMGRPSIHHKIKNGMITIIYLLVTLLLRKMFVH